MPTPLDITGMQYLEWPEEGIRSLGTGVTGSCELSDMAARNCTLVLWKSSELF